MSDSIIVGLISAAASLIVCLVTNGISRAKKDQHIEDELRNINKKLDEHNGYAATMYQLKTDIGIIKNEISHLKEAS